MLTEEAFHLFVGETGMARIIRRAAQLEKLDKNGDVRNQGGIDIPTVQRTINYWFSYCLDLFGGEISNNAAGYFAAGLKGRFKEEERYQDHLALEDIYQLPVVENGRLTTREVPMRNAMNEVLRDEYIKDCERALRKWNAILEEEGSERRLTLPSRRFHRHQGLYADFCFDPEGNLIDRATFEAKADQWLLGPEDKRYLDSIMKPVREPGKFANWIARSPTGSPRPATGSRASPSTTNT
ncbi:MAG: hypothetical protein KC431_03460 [Myxococcales bacterium]|nr:hypothetical protein [Myxococcales bacterium]